MKFGSVPVEHALGCILAHSLTLPDGPLKKGTVLGQQDLGRLRSAEIDDIVVAELGPDDLSETEAAQRLAQRLVSIGLVQNGVTAGRVNIIAEAPGILRVDAGAVAAMNAVDEGITLATLPDYARVAADQLVATVKIIPYGVSLSLLERAVSALGAKPIRHYPFNGGSARLILTKTPGFKPSLLAKGETVVRNRVEALGYELHDVAVVGHNVGELADALETAADLTLILGASATSDRYDVAPSAVCAAGGTITRFGMPVDPGNLLFLGQLGGKPVVGLPGCARSPALNGADWVLERLAAGIDVTDADIAAMGVGGLLKEMPDRPHPRRPRK